MKALVHPHIDGMMDRGEPKPVPATGVEEERPFAEGARVFHDLHEGRAVAAKIVLRPR
jgi:hypothetical protein